MADFVMMPPPVMDRGLQEALLMASQPIMQGLQQRAALQRQFQQQQMQGRDVQNLMAYQQGMTPQQMQYGNLNPQMQADLGMSQRIGQMPVTPPVMQSQFGQQMILQGLGQNMFQPKQSQFLTPEEQRQAALIESGLKPKAESQFGKSQIAAKDDPNGLPIGTAYQISPNGEIKIINRPEPGKIKTEEEKQNVETGLRKEFDSLTKDYRTIRDSYGRIKASAEDPSAAGDLAIIFNFMKILDPGSVVRESEFATAENSAGVPDQIRNLWNKALSGERIAFNRQDFIGRAEKLYKSQESIYKFTTKRYDKLAERYGIDPQNVTTEPYSFENGKPKKNGSLPNMPSIKNDSDYDILPSGTKFIDPNGERRRKP